MYKKEGSGEIIVHRIVQDLKGSFLVKGDNLLDSDGEVPLNSVFGIVRSVDRNRRKVKFGITWGKRMIAILSRRKFLASPLWIARKMIRFFSGKPKE
jgi:hypothetical protein